MPQNPLEFAAFVTWGFYGLATLVGGISLRIGFRIVRSMEKLNLNLAVVVEKVSTHDKTLDRHDNHFERTEERFSHIDREIAALQQGRKTSGR